MTKNITKQAALDRLMNANLTIETLQDHLREAQRNAMPTYMAVRGFGSGKTERWYVGRIEAGRQSITLVALASNEASARALVARLLDKAEA